MIHGCFPYSSSAEKDTRDLAGLPAYELKTDSSLPGPSSSDLCNAVTWGFSVLTSAHNRRYVKLDVNLRKAMSTWVPPCSVNALPTVLTATLTAWKNLEGPKDSGRGLG